MGASGAEITDLISRLRALSRHEHDDLTIGDEAADEAQARPMNWHAQH